jgi:hypothetical protein
VVVRLALAALLCLSGPAAVLAMPARIIILRHGEKADKWKLCDIGQERADALAANYLGRDAANSLFASGEEPAAFLAITLHTLELAYPAAATWNQPITLYPVLPQKDSDEDKVETLNRRTQEAARDLMINTRWQGKTVVMVWEHRHIANKKMEKHFPGEAVTLRQLLNSISSKASLRPGRAAPMIISGSLSMGTKAPMCPRASVWSSRSSAETTKTFPPTIGTNRMG